VDSNVTTANEHTQSLRILVFHKLSHRVVQNLYKAHPVNDVQHAAPASDKRDLVLCECGSDTREEDMVSSNFKSMLIAH
jgi:hypothetical protein